MIVKDLSNSFYPYPKQGNKKVKQVTEIKKKTGKLAKKEKNRFSILTNNLEKCYICSKNKVDIHEIYGGRNRQISMKYGFCIPVCRSCHSKTEIDSKLDLQLKKKCQMEYERTHKRDEFIQIIGKSYLDE